MEIDTSTEISALPPLKKPNDDTILNSEEPPTQGRRKKSILWEYFTLELAGPVRFDARCKHCKKSFAYINGPTLAGTSHLKQHIAHFQGLFAMGTDTSININAPPPLEKHNDGTMLLSSEERPTKGRKKKSYVWKYFTLEPARHDRIDARCKHYDRSFAYANGTKVAGTSHLKLHISSFHQPKRRISSTICSLSKLTLDS